MKYGYWIPITLKILLLQLFLPGRKLFEKYIIVKGLHQKVIHQYAIVLKLP